MLTIYYNHIRTELGNIWTSATDKGLVSIILQQIDEGKIKAVLENHPDIKLQCDEEYFKNIGRKLRAYLKGHKISFDVPLDIDGASKFQIKVWNLIREIPYGKTRTYHQIAKLLGKYRGSSAVGQAIAANPLPIIIPCHRIIRRDGTIGGHKEEKDWKKRLLSIEGHKIINNYIL